MSSRVAHAVVLFVAPASARAIALAITFVITPAAVLAVAFAIVIPGPARAALVINEVLYDPQGADRGAEWAEIHNTGPWPATLEGVALEAGDGGGPGRWTRTWEGSSGEWIEAGGFCVVGGPWRGRAPCSSAVLDLQNGPDGLRLVREGIELDRLGWGELTEGEYYEGRPAGPAGGGISLARAVDGIDTDDNLSDFTATIPTPGRWNHPARDLAVRLGRRGPGVPIDGRTGPLLAVIRLENLGAAGIPAGEIRLYVDGLMVLPDAARIDSVLLPGAAIDLPFPLDVAVDGGVSTWACFVRFDGDLMPDNDADTLRAWVGPSPLRLTEIAPRPGSTGSEWIELECTAERLSVDGWSLQDARGSSLELRGGTVLTAGDRAVVAQDSAAAAAMGLAPVRWRGVWPNLNDTATNGEGADTVWLARADGLCTDWGVYGSTRAGETWVRLEGSPVDAGLEAWVRCVDPTGGSPGRPGSAPASQRLPTLPDRPGETAAVSLAAHPGGAWIRLPPVDAGSRREVRLLRMDGSTAVEFQADGGAERSWVRWDGRTKDGHACPGGVYYLETRITDGVGRARTTRRPLVVGR